MYIVHEKMQSRDLFYIKSKAWKYTWIIKKTHKDSCLQNDILWGLKALCAIPSKGVDYDHHIATSPLSQIIRPTYAPENCYNMAEVLFAIQIRIRWQLPSVEVVRKSL